MALVLVGGGARSGKSRWALDRARKRGGRLVYIATAEALDEEMSERIAKHRASEAAISRRSRSRWNWRKPYDRLKAMRLSWIV